MSAFLSSGRYSERTFSLIGTLSEKLMARNIVLGTAESCTGGLIAALCTEIAGSSRWFAGGVVAYSNTLKSVLLGVPPALLDECGAVSGPVVAAMAKGALDAFPVDLSLAVSGIAGPEGGSEAKPVGTVWIGVGLRLSGGRIGLKEESTAKVAAVRHHFSGDRGEVRLAAALAAFEAASDALDGGAQLRQRDDNHYRQDCLCNS